MKKVLVLLCCILVLSLAGCAGEKEPEVVGTIQTEIATYEALSDGTWRANGYPYLYRLEINGVMPASDQSVTFVYLSNLEEIPSEKAWLAAGWSSELSDYFSEDEAVLVDARYE